MSADRYEINMDELGCWARQSNEAWACVMRFTQDSDSLQERIAEKVIRQQARDLDQLRGELAAAVAERDRLLAELPLSTGRDVNETRERLGPITRIADGPSERAYVCATTAREVVGYVIAERDSAKLRAEQAEARLAAIDGAPTVAIAVHTHTDRGPYKYLSYSELNVPRDGVELIARPAKDQA